MKKFSIWLKEDTDVKTKINLFEKTIAAKMDTLAENPEYLDRLNQVFGTTGMPISDSDASVTDNFLGLFYRTSGSKNGKIAVVTGSTAAEHAKTSKLAKIDAKGTVTITLDDGNVMTVEPSGGGSTGKTKSGVARKYFKNNQNFQEAVFATLIELEIKGELDNLVKANKNPKFSDKKCVSWLIASDAKKKTGICKYVDCSIGKDDPQGFSLAMEDYLTQQNQGKWGKTFETVYRTRWKELLDSVFVSKKPNWRSCKLLRDNVNIKGVDTELLTKYFRGNRCGVPKDTVDKSDIILAFVSGEEINEILKKILSFGPDELQAHNDYMNQLINDCKFIGISLKQLGTGGVRVAAMNVIVTAQGSNIKADKSTAVIYDETDPSNSTFNPKGATLPSADSEGIMTYRIKIPIINRDSIHTKEGAQMVLSVKRQEQRVAAVFQAEKEAAQMGAANAFMNDNGFNIADKIKTAIAKGAGYSAAIQHTAIQLLKLFSAKPLFFYKTFCAAVAYPLVHITDEGTELTADMAPHIKIF